MVHVCGQISQEAFQPSQSLKTRKSPNLDEYFNLLIISWKIISVLCYNDSYCFIISWGCGLIIFNISQRVHYALPNRVYLLHNSRQAFLKRAMYIFPLSELSAINNFHYHLQCKSQIFFLSTYFFLKQNICTTFKPTMLVIYHKIAADVINSTVPDKI